MGQARERRPALPQAQLRVVAEAVPLGTLTAALSQELGIGIVVAPELVDVRVSLSLPDTTAEFGRNLGKAAGTERLGLWQERLPPGRRTSFTHAHSHEEELVYILQGECHVRILEPGAGEAREIPLRAGHTVSFPAGTGIAHCFVNHGTRDCLLLCVGERRRDVDGCFYPEDREYDEHRRLTEPERHWSR